MENENSSQKIVCPICEGATALWGNKNSFALYRCRICGLGFVFPLPTQTDALYDSQYFFGADGVYGYMNYDEDKRSMTHVLERYIDLLNERGRQKGRLLDVGAATGFFVNLVAQHGWQAEGIEISQAAVETARAKNLNVYQGSIENLKTVDTYDAITLLDVLEHLPNPIDALKTANTLLKKDGVLLINVPDAGSLYARLFGCRWHAVIPPEHLWYFTYSSLKRLLTATGFARIQKYKFNKTFSLAYILSTCGRWLSSPTLERLAALCEKTFIGKIKIFLPLYDNVLIVAQKSEAVLD